MEQARQTSTVTRVSVHFPSEVGTGSLCMGAESTEPRSVSHSRNLLRITCSGCLAALDEAYELKEVAIRSDGTITWREIGVCET